MLRLLKFLVLKRGDHALSQSSVHLLLLDAGNGNNAVASLGHLSDEYAGYIFAFIDLDSLDECKGPRIVFEKLDEGLFLACIDLMLVYWIEVFLFQTRLFEQVL